MNSMYCRQEQWKLLDGCRRRSYVRSELKKLLYKSVLKSTATSLTARHLARLRLSALPRSSSVTRVVNRCIRSGRAHMVVNRAQLSRFPFRFESYDGVLPGVRRHSW